MLNSSTCYSSTGGSRRLKLKAFTMLESSLHSKSSECKTSWQHMVCGLSLFGVCAGINLTRFLGFGFVVCFSVSYFTISGLFSYGVNSFVEVFSVWVGFQVARF